MNDRRKKLEDLAQLSVQQNGLKSLSFRTLADEIGIKSSSVHYYFPEKSDLAQALIKRYSEAFSQDSDIIARTQSSLREKVLAFVEIFENVAKDERVCMCGMMASEVESLSVENREALAGFFLEMEHWLTAQFENHVDELSCDLPATVLSKTLVSGLEGALLIDRVIGNDQRLKSQKALFLSWLA